jgi:periplasmic copper chaperone A
LKKTQFFVILLLGLFLVACTSGKQDGVTVEDAWGRPAPMSASNAAFYMTINNTGQEQDSLVAASISICDATELHMSSIDDDGVMSMRQVQQIDVPAGETTTLEPGGLHIMCIGRQADLNPGDTIPISLSFARAGEIAAEASIEEP